jgi:hypothetical protein
LQTMTASIAELSSRTPELLRKLEQSWTRRAA